MSVANVLRAVVTNLGDSVVAAQAFNEPETTFVADVAALQLVNDSEQTPLICRSFLSYAENRQLSQCLIIQFNLLSTLEPPSYYVPFLPPPRKMKNDISRSPLSCPVPLPHKSISLTLNIHIILVSPQESVLLYDYRHEGPIAIMRPLLMLPIKSADN